MAIGSGEIEGLDELINDLLKFGDKVMPRLRDATQDANELLRKNVLNESMVFKHPTGKHIGRIGIRKAKVSKKKMLVTADVNIKDVTGDNYLQHVELGHNLKRKGKWVGYVKPTPFMRPAADKSKQAVENILVAAMDKALKELSK